MSSPDNSPHCSPQRQSEAYQYYNAPEVAPGHGLEHDDNVYPSSDKCPVIQPQYIPHYAGKRGFDSTNRPPRIIFGMKMSTFLVVAAVFGLGVIGAAVGGAVGGKSIRESQSQMTSGQAIPSNTPASASSSSSSTSPTTSPATAAAATPTISPLSDCPASNATNYTSSYASGSSGTAPATAALAFTKYCDVASPLAGSSGGRTLAEAFVYTFDDCIEVCAGYNFWAAGANCTVAVYQAASGRPGNCWVGTAGGGGDGGAAAALLSPSLGEDVALVSN